MSSKCIIALKLILLCAVDVESNPGPTSNAQIEQFDRMFELLQSPNSPSVKLDQNQTSLLNTVQDIKVHQETIESGVADIVGRYFGALC